MFNKLYFVFLRKVQSAIPSKKKIDTVLFRATKEKTKTRVSYDFQLNHIKKKAGESTDRIIG